MIGHLPPLEAYVSEHPASPYDVVIDTDLM